MTIPFVLNNTVIFELTSSPLFVGDLANKPGAFRVDGFQPGAYGLPASGFQKAELGDPAAFSTDNACLFFADAFHYEKLAADPPDFLAVLRDREVLQQIRRQMGYSFGFIIAGDIECNDFKGDGTYTIDPRLIVRAKLAQGRTPRSPRQLLEGALKSMNTLICTKCFDEELNSHPKLGMVPTDSGAKSLWVAAMVKTALDSDWSATNEPSDFGDFSILGPRCKATP
jgi:hypothetical protein